MELRNAETKITGLFLAIQGLLYGSFLALDFTGGSVRLSTRIKYTVIILCFFYTILNHKSIYKKKQLCLRIAFIFTLIADYFLLLQDHHYFYGVLSFLFAQQTYGIKLDLEELPDNAAVKRNLTLRILCRIAIQLTIAGGIGVLLDYTGIVMDRLLFVSLFYFISFLTNIYRSLGIARKYPKNRSNLLFAIGMVLFLLCDLNVGLYNLSDFIPLTAKLDKMIYSFSSIFMWVFYAPSQVLIALSIIDYRQNA